MEEGNSVQQMTCLFKLFSHPARLRILDELRQGEARVCRLQAILRWQPYVSQQLRQLREAGMVESRREGAFIHYRLADSQTLRLLDAVLGPVNEAPHPYRTPSCPISERATTLASVVGGVGISRSTPDPTRGFQAVPSVLHAGAGVLKQLQSLGRWSPVMERASGLVIIGVGLYFLWIA